MVTWLATILGRDACGCPACDVDEKPSSFAMMVCMVYILNLSSRVFEIICLPCTLIEAVLFACSLLISRCSLPCMDECRVEAGR